MPRELRETVTLTAGRNLLRQYNEWRAKGYRTIWSRDGKICLEAPAPGEPLPAPAEVIVNVPVEGENKRRLEEIRVSLRAENISWGELADLQSLVAYIDPSDMELLEAAGVPEFKE